MVPVTAGYPFAWCHFRHVLLQTPGKVGRRRGFSQAHTCDLETTAEQMHMGVHEPGYNHRLTICDYPRTGTYQLCHRDTVPHHSDCFTRNGYGLRPRLSRVSGPDSTVYHEVRPLRSRIRRCRANEGT